MTQKLHSVNWFLVKIYRFTSTILYIILNVLKSLYLYTTDVRVLHKVSKSILQIHSHTIISLDNSSTTSDDHVGDLESHILNKNLQQLSICKHYDTSFYNDVVLKSPTQLYSCIDSKDRVKSHLAGKYSPNKKTKSVLKLINKRTHMMNLREMRSMTESESSLIKLERYRA